jgi:ankyrin repeat protein
VQPFEEPEEHAKSLEAPSPEQDFALSLRHRALSLPTELPVTAGVSRPSESELRLEPTVAVSSKQSPAFTKVMFDFAWATFLSKNAVTPIHASLQHQLHSTQQNLIKKLTGHMDPLLLDVLSNQTPEGIFNTLIRRTKHQFNLECLRGLLLSLALNVHVKHFAENLLVDATIDGNLPLMEALVDSGVDVNARSSQEGAGDSADRKVTALHMAVYNRREDLIRYLLYHGADDWYARYKGANGYVDGSILDIVMEMGSLHEWTIDRPDQITTISCSILSVLLTFRSRTKDQPVQVLLRASRLAVLQNRIDLVHILFCHYPALLIEARSKPWLLLEAAATIHGTALFHALLSMGLYVNATDPRGYGSVMASAAAHSNMPLISVLLAAHVDINGLAFGHGEQDEGDTDIAVSEKKLSGIHGLGALHIAVLNGNERLIRLLLFHAANANQCCRIYPLQIAAWNGREDIVRLLIDHFADVNAITSSYSLESGFSPEGSGRAPIPTDLTPFRIAVLRGHTKVVEILSRNGATLVAGHPDEGLAVLCDAVAHGEVTLVKRLLAQATAMSRLTIRGGTRAMVLAARSQNNYIMEMLLEASFSPFDPIDPGCKGLEDIDDRHMFHSRESPFEIALEHKSTHQVRRFLSFPSEGLDKEQQLSRHRQLSAAYASALCSENTTLADAILEAGLDPDRIDQVMGSNYVQQRLHFALQHAAMSKHYDKVERLLKAGADPNSPNASTADTGRVWTPLQYAAADDNISLVKKLIVAGADVNAPATAIDGATALQSAVIKGNTELLELLVKAGANIDAPPGDYNGRTAIERAAEAGKHDVVNYLLEAGADIKGRNNTNYRRTIYRASKNGYAQLAFNIQEWKILQHGRQDCETIAKVMESMTPQELDFANEAAMMDYEARMRDYDSLDEEDVDESMAED